MDFTQHVPFGKTGMKVSRMGIASGYGAPAASIEKAFHEYGVNYLWLSVFLHRGMKQALRNLLPKHRDELRIVGAWPANMGWLTQNRVEAWLRRYGLEHLDLMILQGQDKPPTAKFVDRVQQLRDSGLTRFVGMSSHNRPLLGEIARGERDVPVDAFQIRYNAVHPGAEQDIFPHLPQRGRPGVVIFTATCWGKLLKPGNLPPGEAPLDPSDPYRFVLSNPDVDVVATAPSSAEQADANLRALELGPLDEDEMARIRRIGEYIHGKGKG
jgi:aryl-alcohol dehydrogenase-like predicted oxidoreductase